MPVEAFASLRESWSLAAALAVAGGAGTVLALRRVLPWLLRRQILDRPNDRSSHKVPTPRGGGLATTPVITGLLLVLALHLGSLPLGLLAGGALALLAISWVDDRRGLPALPRFLTHAAAIAVFLVALPVSATVLGGLVSVAFERVLLGLGWLWFVNLTNFMDGIDGITGVETASLGLGVALVATVGGTPHASVVVPAGVMVAAVGAAFLTFNWHPARLFLGDSGSVPFGLVLGGLLLLLALDGQLAAALILPAYYLADATITLGRRALRGEKVWQAHRQHFYQRAVQGGRRHDQVSLVIAAGNAGLVGAALLAASGSLWLGVGSGVAVIVALLTLLQHWSRGGRA